MLDGVLENVLQVYWVNFIVNFKGELIIKREGNLQDIPCGTKDMSRFLKEWLRTGKCGLDGVMGGMFNTTPTRM